MTITSLTGKAACIAQGIAALLVVFDEADVEVSVGHDIIYVGGPSDADEKDNAKLRPEMKRLGWAWDADYTCWSIFV